MSFTLLILNFSKCECYRQVLRNIEIPELFIGLFLLGQQFENSLEKFQKQMFFFLLLSIF